MSYCIGRRGSCRLASCGPVTIHATTPCAPAADRDAVAVVPLSTGDCSDQAGDAFFRYTSIIGDSLRACSPAGRGTEVDLACNILNQMTGLGRPMSSPRVGVVSISPHRAPGEQEILHARDSVGQNSGATQWCPRPRFSDRIRNSRPTAASSPHQRQSLSVQRQLDCEHHSAACRGRSVTLVGAGGWWPDPQLD